MISSSKVNLQINESKSFILSQLDKACLKVNPYPHLYIKDFLPETLRSCLRKCFDELQFSQNFQGAVPVHHINEKSPSLLLLFRDEIVDGVMTPFFTNVFKHYEQNKILQLKQHSPKIRRSSSADYASIYLAKNPMGGTIPVHLDDCWASFQFVFYLGYACGKPAPTTDLLKINKCKPIKCQTSAVDMTLTNYGNTSNGLLVFVNDSQSFHGLLDPLQAERWTICISAHFYQK